MVPASGLCNYDADLNLDAFGLCNTPLNSYNNLYPEEEPVFRQGSGGGCIVYRTKEGIERFFITDINNPAGSSQAQSSIPAFFDGLGSGIHNTTKIGDTFNHVPGGCNVLFLDGHVEFIKYPGKFPVTHYAAERGMAGTGAGFADVSRNTPVINADFFSQYEPF